MPRYILALDIFDDMLNDLKDIKINTYLISKDPK